VFEYISFAVVILAMVLATTALLARADIGLGGLPLVAILRAGARWPTLACRCAGSSRLPLDEQASS